MSAQAGIRVNFTAPWRAKFYETCRISLRLKNSFLAFFHRPHGWASLRKPKDHIGYVLPQKEGQELPSYGVNLHLLLGLAFPRLWLRLAPGINPVMVIKFA